MDKQHQEYTVGQLARLSGVSVRALHHYDAIGLLVPARTGANGYRVYGRAEMLRLQEILFYRDIGMPLADIAAVLKAPDDMVDRLQRHRARLAAEASRAAQLIETLDATIAHLKGQTDMQVEDLYKPFAPEKQAEYESWLIDTYGPEMTAQIAAAKQAVDAAPEGLEGLMDELRTIEAALVATHEAGADPLSADNHALIERHRDLIARFWGRPCEADAYQGLAQLYESHPDFVARYERLGRRFSVWLPTAMRAHATRLRAAS